METSSKISETLTLASDSQIDSVLKTLEGSLDGLTQPEVAKRLIRFGKNKIVHEKPVTWHGMLLRNFKNPFVLVLITVGILAEITGDHKATIILFGMVLLSILMRFIQEYRSSKAAQQLNAMVLNKTSVTRKINQTSSSNTVEKIDNRCEVLFEDIVPGDIVHVSAGDMIPADIRLITSKDLFVSQSTLTGESLPVEKHETVLANSQQNGFLARANLCFMGTNVVSGTGTGIVVETGNNTYFSSMTQSLVGYRSLTSFDLGINKVSWLLIRFMMVMVPVIFILNGTMKGGWKEALLFSVAIAVGLTPEMLPMVVTANLAKGAVAMSLRKVIVKRLNSIQNLGAMNILCTDKTGTLTQDKIVLRKHLDIQGNESSRVLEFAYINSYYQTGLKNLLDHAVLESGELEHTLDLLHSCHKLDEIPFDFIRRRMSVAIERETGVHELVCKGAVEELLAICTQAEYNGSIVTIDEKLHTTITILVNKLNEDGLRVVAVAQKIIPLTKKAYAVADEIEMTLVGFIAFLDPPKETAAPALKNLKENGVQVKILTGDNDIVTRRICKDVGLPVDKIILGTEIDNLTDETLTKTAEQSCVFAKLNPLQKSRLVKLLRAAGHTVGFLGDGINDAAALREADVGISVDTAADIAKESADIILLEKSLLVIVDGIVEGRKVYGNIIKYIKMTTSSNFGNMFSMLVASIFLPFLPMLPIHLLIQNLCYDFSQLSLPWDNMDPDFLEKPRKWESSNIGRFMVFIGPISSVFDIATFLVLWFIFHANSPSQQSLFQSGWFIEGLVSQTLIVHMIRTDKIPFIQSIAALPVLLTTTIIIIVGILIPFSNIGTNIGLQSLPGNYFIWLVAMLLSYCVLMQIVKNWYIKRFHGWL